MKLNYRNTVVPLMATLTLLAMFLWLMDHLAPTGARANTVRVQFLTASTEAKQTSGKPFSAVNPQGTASSDRNVAWTRLVAAFELYLAAQEIEDEAESNQSIVEAIVKSVRPEQGMKSQEGDDEFARELRKAYQSRAALAEIELVFVRQVLAAARTHTAHTQKALNLAWEGFSHLAPDELHPDWGAFQDRPDRMVPDGGLRAVGEQCWI